MSLSPQVGRSRPWTGSADKPRALQLIPVAETLAEVRIPCSGWACARWLTLRLHDRQSGKLQEALDKLLVLEKQTRNVGLQWQPGDAPNMY